VTGQSIPLSETIAVGSSLYVSGTILAEQERSSPMVMTDDPSPSRNSTRAQQRGAIRHLAVLSALAEAATPLTLNETALALGAPRPSVHRLLTALVHEGWLTATGSPRRYAPSWRAVEIGFLIAKQNRVRDVLLLAATDLARIVRSKTYVAFYEDGDVIFTDSVEVRGDRLIPGLMGVRLPAPINVCGRVLLAFQPKAEIDRALSAELPQLTEWTKTDKEAILNTLGLVRERGYDVMDRENSPGVSGVAVPVFQAADRIAGSLGILIPGPLRLEAVEPLLEPAFRTAQQASDDLGGRF
jgi:DNA-binding IclR family transcriptional regulator